jgi:hypothetical protein
MMPPSLCRAKPRRLDPASICGQAFLGEQRNVTGLGLEEHFVTVDGA